MDLQIHCLVEKDSTMGRESVSNLGHRCQFLSVQQVWGGLAAWSQNAHRRSSSLGNECSPEVPSVGSRAKRYEQRKTERVRRRSEERALALRLLRLPEVLAQLEEDLLPSRLIEPSQQSLWQTVGV